MKKIALAFITLSLSAGSFAQTVFTYGKHAVSKDEFVRAFNKNPGIAGDRKKALREYLNLYINFKLKVQAAYDAGLDKDATQQYELQNFRRQIADNIINDEANVKELVKEAFNRSQKEIRLAHVFIEVPANADTTEAFRKITAAYKDLKEGKDFATVVQQYSNDEPTKQSKGDLGFVTAFTLPYEIENVAYSLQQGAFSAPFKSKLGYHIFKNQFERQSLGTRKVAQILIAYPSDATPDQKNIAYRKADSIYSLLQKGENFGTLAANASNDLSSNNNKGELPEFTIGTYSSEFENVAFSLAKPGDLSKPFATSHGFHIVKLLESKAAPSDISDGATFAALQEKVTSDNRMEVSKRRLIDKKLELIRYKPGPVKEKDVLVFTDSALRKNEVPVVKGINEKTPLFSFANQTVKAGDWIKYIKAAFAGETQGKDYSKLYKDYIRIAADDYYRNHLDVYNADFSRQVKEFKEANLLFGIMEQNVWGKANTDTAGLLNYYNEHKTKYTWPPSADALIITSNSEKVATELQQKLKDNLQNWRQTTSSNGSDVIADSGRYELSQLPITDRTSFTAGMVTAPVKNENDGSYTFNYIIKVYHEPGQRSFDDARGMVISDYQQVLEDKWIAELKKKYPVKVNEAVFQTIK
jgi:peptidyl-prolyl cis-trans isomerase SurA